jgi:hypothetical protein
MAQKAQNVNERYFNTYFIISISFLFKKPSTNKNGAVSDCLHPKGNKNGPMFDCLRLKGNKQQAVSDFLRLKAKKCGAIACI